MSLWTFLGRRADDSFIITHAPTSEMMFYTKPNIHHPLQKENGAIGAVFRFAIMRMMGIERP
jgi:hypothetical protein